MGALNERCNELDAPLASQEDLYDPLWHQNFNNEVDVNTSLLQNSQNKNDKFIVMVKQTNVKVERSKEELSKEIQEIRQKSIHEKAESPDRDVTKSGAISGRLYWSYAHAGTSLFGILIFLFSTLVSHGLFRFTDSWLGVWTSNERLVHMQNLTNAIELYNTSDLRPLEQFNRINEDHLMVYCFSVLTLIVSCLVMIARRFIMCIDASRTLHNQMFSR